MSENTDIGTLARREVVYVVGWETKHGFMYVHRGETAENRGMTKNRTFHVREAKRWKTKEGARAYAARFTKGAVVHTIAGRA